VLNVEIDVLDVEDDVLNEIAAVSLEVDVNIQQISSRTVVIEVNIVVKTIVKACSAPVLVKEVEDGTNEWVQELVVGCVW
jgi:hypothetical protein